MIDRLEGLMNEVNTYLDKKSPNIFYQLVLMKEIQGLLYRRLN